MTQIKMVVFDMAGTTVDEGKIVYKAVTRALNNAGIDIDIQGVMSQIAGWNKKKGIAHLADKYHPSPDAVLKEDLHDDFLKIVEHEYRTNPSITEMPGASDLFHFLNKKGIKVVLDTGYHRRTANILIDRLNWQDKIDYSVTSDEVKDGRPHPFMIEKARDYFNVKDPASIMKVGDAPADVEEGHNAGCGMVVAMLKDNPNLEQVMNKNPTHTITELQDLKALVEQ